MRRGQEHSASGERQSHPGWRRGLLPPFCGCLGAWGGPGCSLFGVQTVAISGVGRGGSQRNKGRAVGTCETPVLGEWGRGLRSWARCVGGAIRACEIWAVTVKGTPSTRRLLEPGLYKNNTHTSGVVCEYRCGGYSTTRQPSERR